jgi:hypothetical protein
MYRLPVKFVDLINLSSTWFVPYSENAITMKSSPDMLPYQLKRFVSILGKVNISLLQTVTIVDHTLDFAWGKRFVIRSMPLQPLGNVAPALELSLFEDMLHIQLCILFRRPRRLIMQSWIMILLCHHNHSLSGHQSLTLMRM